jgi:hypothetical protein
MVSSIIVQRHDFDMVAFLKIPGVGKPPSLYFMFLEASVVDIGEGRLELVEKKKKEVDSRIW